jgi:hypothetical protein
VASFILMYQLCREATSHTRIVALVGFVACLANYGFLRPQTYSFLLFSAFYLILWRYRDGRRDQLWLLPVLMALWVNLHGAFLMGLILVALYGVSEGLRRLMDPNRSDALSIAQLRKLVVVFALCGVATLLNPEGYGIYDYVRAVLGDAGSQQLVAEWQPPRVNEFLGVLLFYGPFLLALFVFIQARVKPDLTEMALFSAFAILGLSSIRNAAWFGTITFPLIARYMPLMDLSPLYPLRRFRVVDRLFESETAAADGVEYGRMNALLLVAAVVLLVSQSPWFRPAITGKSLLAEQTPVAVADFIAKEKIAGRVFHPQEFGDYLLWRLWPQQKTVVDGRVHLFNLEFLKQYKKALEDPLSSGFLERWNVEYLLLSKLPDGSTRQTIGSIRNSDAWAPLYEDEISVLFARKPELARAVLRESLPGGEQSQLNAIGNQ